MKHPGEEELTLYAGGDLGMLALWRIGAHVRDCELCVSEVAKIRAVTTVLRAKAAELPREVNWERLSAEMTANIHVGLEAGECVGPRRAQRPEFIGWRAVAVMAGLTVVLMGAWWLNPPRTGVRDMEMRRAESIEIATAPEGIEVKENGSAMTLLHTRGNGNEKPIFVSAPGTLRARFVDEDTGQVTINNVYTD